MPIWGKRDTGKNPVCLSPVREELVLEEEGEKQFGAGEEREKALVCLIRIAIQSLRSTDACKSAHVCVYAPTRVHAHREKERHKRDVLCN